MKSYVWPLGITALTGIALFLTRSKEDKPADKPPATTTTTAPGKIVINAPRKPVTFEDLKNRPQHVPRFP